MRLTNKTLRWDYGETWVGRKKNYEVKISYSAHLLNKETPYWYYVLKKGDYAYNSLWNDLKYPSKEDCVNAAEIKIDELIKTQSKNLPTDNCIDTEDKEICE